MPHLDVSDQKGKHGNCFEEGVLPLPSLKYNLHLDFHNVWQAYVI